MDSKSISMSVKRMKKIPHVRIAYTAMIASILLVASLAVMNPLNAAATGGARITATSSYTCVSVLVAPDGPMLGGLQLRTIYLVCTHTGDLEGKTACTTTPLAIDDGELQRSFTTSQCTFIGKLKDSELGIFHYSATSTNDRSSCAPFSAPCAAPIEQIRFNIVEGSGLKAFEGICGLGIGTDVPGPTVNVDWTLRFGKNCKANN